MTLRLALAALALAACSPPPTTRRCVPATAEPGRGSAALGRTGSEYRFSVVAPLVPCPTDSPTVDVEVWDPTDTRVAATATLDRQPDRLAVSVSFTPQAPGAYAWRVRFDPALGQVQGTAVVARPRTDAPATALIPSVGRCDAIARTAAGAVLCLETAISTVTVYRQGAAPEQFAGRALGVTKNVAWSITGAGTIERRVDTGQALALAGSLGVTGGELFGTGELDEARFVRQRRSATGTIDLVVVRWDGQQLVLEEARPAVGRDYALVEPGVAWTFSATSICSNQDCEVATVVGVDPGGAWLADGSSLQRVRRPLARPLRALSVALPPGIQPRQAYFQPNTPPAPRVLEDVPELELPVDSPAGPYLEVWSVQRTKLRVIDPEWIIADGASADVLEFYAR